MAASSGPARTHHQVRAELAEAERHLQELPPHHGGGRAALERRIGALHRELAELRARGRTSAPDPTRSRT